MSGAPLQDGQHLPYRQQNGQHSLAGNSSEQQPLLHDRPALSRTPSSSSSLSSASSNGRRHGSYQSNALHSSTSGDTIVSVGDAPQNVGTVPEKLRQHHEWTRERFSFKWWLEWIAIFFVFSVTGSSSMMLVRPLMKVLGLVGSMREGPWLYRIAYIVLTLPVYSVVLLCVATLLGRRHYFEYILQKMWGKILPKRLQCWRTA